MLHFPDQTLTVLLSVIPQLTINTHPTTTLLTTKTPTLKVINLEKNHSNGTTTTPTTPTTPTTSSPIPLHMPVSNDIHHMNTTNPHPEKNVNLLHLRDIDEEKLALFHLKESMPPPLMILPTSKALNTPPTTHHFLL
jgi:hypothetical protein